MGIVRFSKLVNFLLIYMAVVIVALGLFGRNVVSDMVYFVYIYGVPLLVFIVLYFSAVAITVQEFIQQKTVNIKVLFFASSKMLLSMVPFFYLNNTGAYVLTMLRLG